MRLQILELPVQHLGDVMYTPFVLVASEVKPFDHNAMATTDGYRRLREDSGAAAFFMTSDVVEIGPA